MPMVEVHAFHAKEDIPLLHQVRLNVAYVLKIRSGMAEVKCIAFHALLDQYHFQGACHLIIATLT